MSEGKDGVPTSGYQDPWVTNFNLQNFNGLKDMLDGANPEAVRTVARHWQNLSDDLEELGKKFSKAVEKVMEHWQGESADRFQKRANQIAENFKAGAPWAAGTAGVMGDTAKSLQEAVDKIAMKDDGWGFGDLFDWGSFGGGIDDDELDDALKKGASARGLLKANKDDLDDDQTLRLESTVAMEDLASSYMTNSRKLKPPEPGKGGIDDKIPEHDKKDQNNGPGGINQPMMPSGGLKGGGGGLKLPKRGMTSGSAPNMPTSPDLKQPGISGGMGELKHPKMPDVGTGLDSAGPGLKVPNGPSGGPPGGGGLHMPSGGGPHGPSGGPGPIGMPNGMPPGRGGTGGLKSGSTGGLKGGSTGTGPNGPGSRSGRTGMPGMGGMHGAGGGKGAGGGRGGAGTGGPQARQKGGIIGSPGGKTSGGGQGGSGLHRSRGGTASGANSGGRRPAGMMGGAHGAPGAKGEGKGKDTSRPDYLMEEEETWASKRNVAPPVIE